MMTPREPERRHDVFAPQVEPVPSGIGGWLILPAIGLVVTPLILGYSIYQTLQVFGTPGYLQLTTPDSPRFNPAYKPFLLSEIAANGFLIALVVVAAAFFFSKHRFAPRLMIAFYAVSMIILVLDIVLANRLLDVAIDRDAIKELGRAVMNVVIWIPYFLVSKRVAQTFGRAGPSS